jgi:hypothetical protein
LGAGARTELLHGERDAWKSSSERIGGAIYFACQCREEARRLGRK